MNTLPHPRPSFHLHHQHLQDHNCLVQGQMFPTDSLLSLYEFVHQVDLLFLPLHLHCIFNLHYNIPHHDLKNLTNLGVSRLVILHLCFAKQVHLMLASFIAQLQLANQVRVLSQALLLLHFYCQVNSLQTQIPLCFYLSLLQGYFHQESLQCHYLLYSYFIYFDLIAFLLCYFSIIIIIMLNFLQLQKVFHPSTI